MPATTTRTPTNGLVSVTKHSWSDDGMFDHDEHWIECPTCKATVFGEHDEEFPTEAELDVHVSGQCIKILEEHKAHALAAAAERPVIEEPF